MKLTIIKSSVGYAIAGIMLFAGLSVTSCGGRDYDTQSDQNFSNEEALTQSNTGDTTDPAGIREDSTPAAHPDLDDNPVIDKGMSSDSAMRDNSKIKQ